MTASPAASARRLRRSTLLTRVPGHRRRSVIRSGAKAGTPQGSGTGAGGRPCPRTSEGPPAPEDRGGLRKPEGPEATCPVYEGGESSAMVVTACRVRGSVKRAATPGAPHDPRSRGVLLRPVDGVRGVEKLLTRTRDRASPGGRDHAPRTKARPAQSGVVPEMRESLTAGSLRTAGGLPHHPGPSARPGAPLRSEALRDAEAPLGVGPGSGPHRPTPRYGRVMPVFKPLSAFPQWQSRSPSAGSPATASNSTSLSLSTFAAKTVSTSS